MCDTWLKQRPQRLKHLRWTIDGPDSSYSSLEIHICWKVDSEARMEPPIHTEYLRSGGAMILIFMVDGARAVSSFCMRSAMPGTWWCRPTARRCRTGPYGCRRRTHDRVVGGLVHAGRLHAQERGLEQSLGAAEALVADGDHLAVGKLVRLLQRRRRRGGLHLL